ncbi:ABC transporter permease [Chloroflexota bacterium]
MSPPEVRAMAYVPPWSGSGKGNLENLIEHTIVEQGFRDPFVTQYARWAGNLLRGDWGFSIVMKDEVLDVLLSRTPATVELLLFSLLLFVPLGLISGVAAGWKRGTRTDFGFRSTAFIATSFPPFVLGLMLLAIFYIGLHWFLPGRLSPTISMDVNSAEFNNITGLVMIDGLLNLRPDVTVDAIRHLLLPAITLGLTYWAVLGRITRAAMIEELNQDYVMTAKGKGLKMRQVVWQHAFRNAMVPGLSSIALSAAMFLTVAFVVEIIFDYPGLSRPLTGSAQQWWVSPDVDLAMGFAVYSALLVLPLMFILDVILAIVDPRIRDGVSE